jgi:hypothetical protein
MQEEDVLLFTLCPKCLEKESGTTLKAKGSSKKRVEYPLPFIISSRRLSSMEDRVGKPPISSTAVRLTANADLESPTGSTKFMKAEKVDESVLGRL